MDKIKIAGGGPLNGVIPISGAKNAALPLMIASLLTRDTLTLANMPLLADVTQLERILGNHGVDIMVGGKRSGETADHAAVMQAADLPGVGLHHRLPHGDLSVPSDDDFAILADGHDGGAMPDGHG